MTVVPRSLTTMEAPCWANRIATARPMPPPAPVTTAARPSSLFAMAPTSMSVITRHQFNAAGISRSSSSTVKAPHLCRLRTTVGSS